MRGVRALSALVTLAVRGGASLDDLFQYKHTLRLLVSRIVGGMGTPHVAHGAFPLGEVPFSERL